MYSNYVDIVYSRFILVSESSQLLKLNTTIETVMLLCIDKRHDNVKF